MNDPDQKHSKNIASLLGPVLIAVTLSEAINLHIWADSFPQVTYLNGMILFSVGLAVVRFHNRWLPAWTVTITILGWLMLVAGLFRLFFPGAEQAGGSPATYVFIGGLCLLGLFLTLKAYC